MKSIFAVFSQIDRAREAVDELIDDGYKQEQMNSVVQEAVGKSFLDVNRQELKVEMTDALGGRRVRNLDALFGGQQGVFTPDAGRVLAAGPAATIMAKASAGTDTAAQGLEDALKTFAVPENTARTYQKKISSGGILFWMRVDDEKVYEAVSVIKNHQGSDVLTLQ
ncbi:MAG: hypothetical protein ACLFVE_05505 [Chitinispirillaceae bacterium]